MSFKSAFGGSGGFGQSPLDAPAPHHSHHGILHNLLEDAINTAKGIPFGLVQTAEHPIRSIKLMGKSYADEYGHGWGHFWTMFHAHPLQPLLDAISVPLLLAGGAGAAVKGASFAAEAGGGAARAAEVASALDKANALTKAGKFAEADSVRASVMRMPKLDYAAQAFRKGTTRTTRMVDTGLEGISLPKAYSSNLFRRALTKGSESILEGVLGKKIDYFSTQHLGDRMLAKTLGQRNQATVARMFGQAQVLREAKKAGVAPEEVGQKLVENFRRVHQENAIPVSVEHAEALAKNPKFREHFDFIHRDSGDIGKVMLKDRRGRVINEGVPVEPGLADELSRVVERQPDHLQGMTKELQARMGVEQTGWVDAAEPAFTDETALVQKGDVVAHPDHPLKGYSTEQTKDFIRTMGESVRTTGKAKDALVKDGNVLVVRKGLGKAMQKDLEGSADLANRIYRAPLGVWKAFILAAAPRYFVNNVVGNAGMYAAATNPVEFTRGVIGAIKSARGIRAASRFEKQAGHTVDSLMAKYLPDEWIAENMGYMTHSALGIDQSIGFGQAGRMQKAISGGLHPITEKIAYKGTQRASLMGAMTTDGDFRRLYRGFVKGGVRREEAFQRAAKSIIQNPVKRAAMEKRVADWAGQYYHLNSLERALTAFVPFYNWDRHALRFGKEQVLSRPVRSAVLSQLGALGDKEAGKELGHLPDFLKGAIPLPGHAKGLLGLLVGQQGIGRQKVLLTSGYNPLAAAAEDAHAIAALVGGRSPGEAIGGQVNPLIAGFISGVTGQQVFSGAKVHAKGGPVGAALAEAFGQLPQTRILKEELLGGPSQKTKKGEPTLYTKDERQLISSLFGFNERDFSPKAAERLYREEHHIKKGRRRKKHDAFAAAGALKSQIKFK